MKTLVKVQEIEGEGLVGLLGKKVTLYCTVYIYAGILVGVNETCVKLKDACIVYETGAFNVKTWANSEKFPNDWYVQLISIESFGELK